MTTYKKRKQKKIKEGTEREVRKNKKSKIDYFIIICILIVSFIELNKLIEVVLNGFEGLK